MQPIPETSPAFTNTQLLLLKAFASNFTEAELIELRQAYVQILGRRATKAANNAWDANGWTDEDVDRILSTKLRSGRG